MKTIMLIEDDKLDRDLFCEVLKKIDPDIDYITAGDAEEALHYLTREHSNLPDLIFLDLNLPHIHGIECLSEIKKVKKLSAVPVIIYSGTKSETQKQKSKELGAAYYLEKPLRFSEIIQEVRKVLKKFEL